MCLETEHRERRGLHSLWKEAWSFSWGIFVTIYLPMRISTHLYCGQLLIDYVLLLNVSASQQNKCYITTQGGRLPCKRIIHFVAQDDIKFLVSKVLQECELQQYTSVTFPAIGTGLCLPSEMGSVHSADGFCWSQGSSAEFDLSGEFILWWKYTQKLQTLKLSLEAYEDLESLTPCSQLICKEYECSRADTSLLTGIQRYVYTSWRTINTCHSSLIHMGSSSENNPGSCYSIAQIGRWCSSG